jgi:DNA-binding HxlR family transcriptional regulator
MAKRKDRVICPVTTTLGLIGGKYKPLILWHLNNGTLRFGELEKLVANASPAMVTRQLRELERDKLISRKVYPVVPPKVEYSLTPFGRSLKPIFSAMFDWGNKYLRKKGVKANCSMVKE